MAATWSSDHSAIYHNLHLCLAIANNLSLAIGLTWVDWKVRLMQLRHPFNSHKLMHKHESQLRYKGKQSSRTVVRCTGACLDPKAILVSSHLVLVDHRTPFALAPLEFSILASHDLLVYA
jgi:hypothetical protein